MDDNMEPDSEEFPSFMTPLLLAAQCGRYETVEYLLNHGHKLDIPHPPRCKCEERCMTEIIGTNMITDGCKRLNAYRAMSDPTYLCCTSASDPILACFLLHDELLECGSVDQVYKTVYIALAQQVNYNLNTVRVFSRNKRGQIYCCNLRASDKNSYVVVLKIFK